MDGAEIVNGCEVAGFQEHYRWRSNCLWCIASWDGCLHSVLCRVDDGAYEAMKDGTRPIWIPGVITQELIRLAAKQRKAGEGTI